MHNHDYLIRAQTSIGQPRKPSFRASADSPEEAAQQIREALAQGYGGVHVTRYARVPGCDFPVPVIRKLMLGERAKGLADRVAAGAMEDRELWDTTGPRLGLSVRDVFGRE